jgi:hypothetical protein
MEFKFSHRQEHLYIELLRDLSAAERMKITCFMSSWTIARQREEIAATHPELSPQEVIFKWMEIHYGKKLTDEVREDLKRRELESSAELKNPA